MFDIEHLIRLVEDEPCLWDKKLTEYSDRNFRDRAWRTICERFYQDWDSIDVKSQDAKVKDLKSKWRNIRDTFMRSLSKSGEPGHKRKKYIYSEHLEFLLNASDKRQTNNVEKTDPGEELQEDNSMDEDEPTEEQFAYTPVQTSYTPVQTSNTPDETLYTPVEASYTPISSPPPQPTVTRLEKKKLRTFQTQLLNILDTPKPKQDDQDADRLFLLSLLPDLRSLHDDDKYDFKIGTLQVMRDLKRKRTVIEDAQTS
ncbi:uncharacterized protein LOC128996895 [Macrosteles quadrilineatus]|uniref:uncharacterized protein LOC128996895 n=1 Tax=Macrosteles quadrilineatus TaxID=74068 RepID=UPI0023E2204B|nr:uncharacterized protein LOC128996895 [Macrosteles quadrilineatus]